MERRKPPEEKRRAIENLLSREGGDATIIRRPGDEETKVRKTRHRSFELNQGENPFELEKPDDAIEHVEVDLEKDEPVSDGYAPTGYGAVAAFDDDEPDETPVKTGGGNNGARNAIIITVAILFIGAAATAMILAREQIMSLFTGNPGVDSNSAAGERIEELEEENADLRARLESGGQANVELGNLRRANASLQQSLENERNRADNLQGQLDTFKNAEPSDDPEFQNAQNQVEKLTADLETARTNISEIQQKLDDANARMVNYTRENSRLNQELESAKRDAGNMSSLRRENERLNSRVDSLARDLDSANSQIKVLRSRVSEGESSNEQLNKVNTEYRRVLELLKESRDANNHKQDRIDELLAENGKLREQVDGLERRVVSNETRVASTNPSGSTTSSETTRNPMPVEIVRPDYPASALRRRVAGTVELSVLVSEQGTVLDAKVIRSPDSMRTLDRAALAAVRKWRFSPALRNGQAVRVWHRVPMEFTLSRNEEE